MNNRERLGHVFHRIEASVAAHRLPVCVFDLDSTLFDTGGRNQRILREFAAERGDPALEAAVAGIGVGEFGWSIAAPLAARGFDAPELTRALHTYWAARFFTDAYVLYDHPSPGAPAFVRGCYEQGAFVYYLTGRHFGGMEQGTARALGDHGFPIYRGRTAIHLKPSFDLPDTAFKQHALREVRSLHGEVVATFENEPGNANIFLAAFPEALHFLYGDVHSPEAPAPRPEIIRIADFHVAASPR